MRFHECIQPVTLRGPDRCPGNWGWRMAGIALALFWVTVTTAPPTLADNGDDEAIERAVVQIDVTQQSADWYTPWQMQRPVRSTGSGFIVGPGWVMTNAHVVSDARQIVVRRHKDNTPYFAQVAFMAHDSDLALLRVAHKEFGKDIAPLELGGLPSLRSRVRTYGYPAGGEKISRTEGVVSRIQFITYVHSGADRHLGIQTDSAINPGNSGGPVIQDGKVVGVAFQANQRLNDVGYFIPTSVVRRFIADIEDGKYDGYVDLGVSTSNLINPVYRRSLGLGEELVGVVVDRIHPGSSADGLLMENDVLLSIEGVPIFADGTFDYHGHLLNFEQLVEEKLKGEKISLRLLREGKEQDVAIPLKSHPDAERMRAQFDVLPTYLVHAGLVFVELNQEFMKTFGNYWENAEKFLLYQHFYSFVESGKLSKPVVVFGRLLSHEINTPYGRFVNSIVTEVNGRPIGSMSDLATALENPSKGYHVFKMDPGGNTMVLEVKAANAAHGEILRAYGIQQERRLP